MPGKWLRASGALGDVQQTCKFRIRHVGRMSLSYIMTKCLRWFMTRCGLHVAFLPVSLLRRRAGDPRNWTECFCHSSIQLQECENELQQWIRAHETGSDKLPIQAFTCVAVGWWCCWLKLNCAEEAQMLLEVLAKIFFFFVMLLLSGNLTVWKFSFQYFLWEWFYLCLQLSNLEGHFPWGIMKAFWFRV